MFDSVMDDDGVPKEVEDLVSFARASVAKAFGVEPDLTPETLPLVDQYLRQLPADAAEEVQHLVIVSVGCYFGEVVRRKLHGRWAVYDSAPEHWRIELINCFLHFEPVGMAGEVFVGADSEDYNGSFGTLDELRDGLEGMLQRAAPISEEEYYSLSGRVDVLQLAADWLVGRSLASGQPVRRYAAEDYLCRLGTDEMNA